MRVLAVEDEVTLLIYSGKAQIATHEDLKDKAQTVTVEKPEQPKKPETPKQSVTPKTPETPQTSTVTPATPGSKVTKTDRPKTGDDMPVALFITLIAGAGAALTGIGVARKKGLL